MSAATGQTAESELRAKLNSLEEQHQERLESLTNKCLAFEEELGKSPAGTVSWQCSHTISPAAHQKQTSKASEAILKAQVQAMETSSQEQ